MGNSYVAVCAGCRNEMTYVSQGAFKCEAARRELEGRKR